MHIFSRVITTHKAAVVIILVMSVCLEVIRSRSWLHEQKNAKCYPPPLRLSESMTTTATPAHCITEGWRANMTMGNSMHHISARLYKAISIL